MNENFNPFVTIISYNHETDQFYEGIQKNYNPKKKLDSGTKVSTGYFIVGSWDNTACMFSTSSQPVQHPTETVARIEAERLSKTNPNKTFIVLEVKGACRITQTIWE